MKNIVKKVMLAVVLITFLSPLAFSQPGEGWNLKRLESKLNLTDAQKDQVEKLLLEHQKAMVDLKAKLEKARIESREITSKDDFSRSEYLTAHNKMAKLRDDIQLAAVNHRMDVLDLMNKDQRKIFLDSNLKFDGKKRNFMRKGLKDDHYRGFGFKPRQRCLW